jgi:hypothetical protein
VDVNGSDGDASWAILICMSGDCAVGCCVMVTTEVTTQSTILLVGSVNGYPCGGSR